MEDEWFFDIDPDKARERFPPAEKLRRFGEPGSAEHKEKVIQYRSVHRHWAHSGLDLSLDVCSTIPA